MGNPTTYKNQKLTWTKVRQLAKYGNNTFQYGADSIRYKKNNTVYTLDGSTVLKETDGTKTITYYHGNGGAVGFCYKDANGTKSDYFFEKNLQGDVTAIYNSNGVKQAAYVYDAWGKILLMTDGNGNDISKNTSHIGYINPIRYRGYYYDVETKLYYLESRYYDPELGRFLNADSLDYLGEGSDLQNYNLYSYCENNPVMYSDSSGHWIETVFDLFSLGASVVEVVINPADLWNWAGLIGDAVDLLPFVTGIGEGVRATKMVKYADEVIDASYDTIKFVKAADLADNFADGGKMLDNFKHVDDYYNFTVSNHVDGTKLHKLFMGNGGRIGETKLRFDGLNELTNTLFELKPYNIANARRGVKQILNYNDALGGIHKMVIVLY